MLVLEDSAPGGHHLIPPAAPSGSQDHELWFEDLWPPENQVHLTSLTQELKLTAT